MRINKNLMKIQENLMKICGNLPLLCVTLLLSAAPVRHSAAKGRRMQTTSMERGKIPFQTFPIDSVCILRPFAALCLVVHKGEPLDTGRSPKDSGDPGGQTGKRGGG